MQSKYNQEVHNQNQYNSNSSQLQKTPDQGACQSIPKSMDPKDFNHRPDIIGHEKLVNGHGQHQSPPIQNRDQKTEAQVKEAREVEEAAQVPVQTFELQNFEKLHENFDSVHHQVMPKVEFTQAHLMTTNLKEAASIVTTSTPCARPNGTSQSAAPMPSGNPHFHKHDYVHSLLHMCLSSDMQQLSRLLLNLGPHDKSSNFLLEQRSLHRAQATENRPIRDLVNQEVVAEEEWVRVQEQVAKARAEASITAKNDQFSSPLSSETQEDSGQNPANIDSNGKSQDAVFDCEKIAKVITQIRRYGQKYLAPKDGLEYASEPIDSKQLLTFNVKQLQERVEARKSKNQLNGSKDCLKYDIVSKKQQEELFESLPNGAVPLVTICKKLRQDQQFKDHQNKLVKKQGDKKRECKANSKSNNGAIVNDVYIQDTVKEKTDLKRKINHIETVMGLEKRLKVDEKEDQAKPNEENKIMTATEVDLKPVNNRTFEIQNALFDFCGINLDKIDEAKDNKKSDLYSHSGRVERFFGKIRKLPNNSNLLQNYGDKLLDLNEEEQDEEDEIDDESKKQPENRMVKLIGLQPEKLFEKVPKYKIHLDKLPHFSCDFDPIDTLHPSLTSNAPLPSNSLLHPLASPLNFQRIDGRPVISLHFNPFELSEADQASSPNKQLYTSQMHDILMTRAQLKQAPREAKRQQEAANFKRAWQNIVRKDIPKAYRVYQKSKAEAEAVSRRTAQGCLKECRKRAVRTQRLAKESVMRARRLTKDMVQFWRRRDREIADSKRKREKIDKELKKRQQEEEEALLQKKRLEYLMQQSEIYAHFMSAKLGVNDEHNKGKQDIDNIGLRRDKRLDIDKKAARKQIAGIINDNRKRLDEFDNHERYEIDEEDLQEHKFNDPKQLTISVEAPKMFKGDLKAYQLKGLQWLDNLYDQGINGILADEMGLGKTIQAISLMAHLAEKKNVWGPFLIVVPVTTLHNWQNELQKFCPDLKVLPYFGSAEERKKLAKFLDPKNLYNPAMRIHVLITSYNIVVGGNTVNKDQMRLQRVKWHYMILDEAQAIKNNQSRRWKTLLQFQTRNRLLLSGTPIQNSMAELWALLHFIMPKLFDNHEQFQEWFSKDIEQHSMDQGELNKHQLKRLHLILQPFMLRRLKKDVEQEIAPKVEQTISCEMTHRQKVLYDRIKRKLSMQDLFQQVKTKQKMENLMNLVMQFRKVCNHPDLFEKRLGKIPFVFSKMNHGMIPNMAVASKPEVVKTTATPITYHLSKLVFDECFFVSENQTRLFTRYAKFRDAAHSTVSVKTHFALFNIFNEQNLYEQIFNSSQGSFCQNTFSILGLLASSNNWSLSTLAYLAVAQSNTTSGDLMQTVALLHYYTQKAAKSDYFNLHNNDSKLIFNKSIGFAFSASGQNDIPIYRPDALVSSFVSKNSWSQLYRESVEENLDLGIEGQWVVRQALIPDDPVDWLGWTRKVKKMVGQIYFDKVVCEPIEIHCESTAAKRWISAVCNNPMAKKALVGKRFKPAKDYYVGRVGRDRCAFLTQDEAVSVLAAPMSKSFEDGPPNGYKLIDDGLLEANYQIKGSSFFQLPDYSRMITDCSKMNVMAELLQRLHREGHRCLIFCQMTKMMDILEDFLIWQKFSYFRMDGSTMLQDRRFMVEEYQTNPNIFAFILSTRAGGLGINLIAADTVIFYDNDWNPTMDSQATDRAHRIGQRKTVHVYRLVTSSTIEERILQRARQKESVQSTVYGANLKADSFSARDAVEMIYDDIAPGSSAVPCAPTNNNVKGFIKGTGKGAGGKGAKGKKKGKTGAADEQDGEGGGRRRRIPKREEWSKFDKEWEQLVGTTEEVEGAAVTQEILEVEEEDAVDSGSDGEMSQDSEIDDTKDAKYRLLKMLEQKGAAKQVFNFQEDDGQELGQQLLAAKNEANGGVGKANRGRPRNQPNPGNGAKNQIGEDEEMDDGIDNEDEEAEY